MNNKMFDIPSPSLVSLAFFIPYSDQLKETAEECSMLS